MQFPRALLGAVVALFVSGATGCVLHVDDDDYVDAGYFRARWIVTGPGGQPATCSDAGGVTVSYLFTDSYGQDYEDLFDCVDGRGSTDPLPIDDFVVSVALLDAAGRLLGESYSFSETLYVCDRISGGYCVNDLPLVEFRF